MTAVDAIPVTDERNEILEAVNEALAQGCDAYVPPDAVWRKESGTVTRNSSATIRQHVEGPRGLVLGFTLPEDDAGAGAVCCPCEDLDLEDPPPHLAECPFADPNYEPEMPL